MGAISSPKITELLRIWSAGDEGAFAELSELVYRELHKLAKRYMKRESPGHLLQTTALVNELWLRLAKYKPAEWQDRGHFYAVSSKAMRRILLDFAPNGPIPTPFGEEPPEIKSMRAPELVALDEALNVLAKLDPLQGRLVELRFFLGLSADEIAEVLQISPRQYFREWKAAKQFLYHQMIKSEI